MIQYYELVVDGVVRGRMAITTNLMGFGINMDGDIQVRPIDPCEQEPLAQPLLPEEQPVRREPPRRLSRRPS
jgi:hypothetical protein